MRRSVCVNIWSAHQLNWHTGAASAYTLTGQHHMCCAWFFLLLHYYYYYYFAQKWAKRSDWASLIFPKTILQSVRASGMNLTCCADFFWSIFILFCFGYLPPPCCFVFNVPPPPPRPTFDFITSDIPVYSCPRTKEYWGISSEILSYLISSQHVLNSLQ